MERRLSILLSCRVIEQLYITAGSHAGANDAGAHPTLSSISILSHLEASTSVSPDRSHPSFQYIMLDKHVVGQVSKY